MKYLILLSITLCSVVLTNKIETKTQYVYENGFFNGEFVSWHKNGTKKAEGNYLNNQKIGNWNIWDSTGQLLMKREYKNSFDFKITEAYNENGATNDYTTFKKYNLKHNSDNYITYSVVKEKDIIWSKRIWRIIEPSQINSVFFKDNNLFNTLKEIIYTNENISVYSSSSDEMKTKSTKDELDKIFNRPELKVEAFKLKEDCFYNKEMQMNETRIISICPVLDNGSDLFWLYYPQLRSYLAKKNISVEDNSFNIENLDDLFFYRQFNSMIYKESNIYDRKISAYKKDNEIKSEAERIEIKMLEMELNTWVNQQKKDKK